MCITHHLRKTPIDFGIKMSTVKVTGQGISLPPQIIFCVVTPVVLISFTQIHICITHHRETYIDLGVKGLGYRS